MTAFVFAIQRAGIASLGNRAVAWPLSKTGGVDHAQRPGTC